MVTKSMKKIRFTDSVRNIKKQLISWLSIIVISSFAVAAYLGLTYSAYGLGSAGENIYKSTNFRDIQITSNCLLSKEDIEEIKNTPGINQVEGQYRVLARLLSDSESKNIMIMSVPKTIDLPILKSGRLPENSKECVVEENIADGMSLMIGDVIFVEDKYGEELHEVSEDEFTVTGTFVHSDHISHDLDETYCMLVDTSAFELEKFDNCYPLVNITFDKKKYGSLFDEKYFEDADKYVDTLESLGEIRSPYRYEKHLSFLKDQIEDSKKDLKQAKGMVDLAGRMTSSMQSKTGQVMADMSNMLSVIISEDPSEYKTADQQVKDAENAEKSYENALKKVADTQKSYDTLMSKGECVWYVFNRNSCLDFVYLKSNSENLRSLNTSFSSLFVVIAIMVIFASLSRMVLEQRTLIGVSKALGMYAGEIFSKYLMFGLSSSILGIITGIMLSAFIIETVVGLGYADHFIFGLFPTVAPPIPTVITFIIAILVAYLSIYFSCSQLLKESAKKLMTPKVPKGRSKAIESNPFLKRLSLYNRMILLNMRSDIVRVMVTIISVAGCCSLVVIGFSLRNNIMGALNAQMEIYTKYDGKIKINSSLSNSVYKDIEKIISKEDAEGFSFYNAHSSLYVDDTMEYTELLISDDLKSLSSYRPILDTKTGKSIAEEQGIRDGIIISTRLSEMYNLKKGDVISIVDDMGYKHNVTISGIMRNNIGRYTVISKSYYEEVLSDTFEDNAFFVRYKNPGSETEFVDKISAVKGFESYQAASELMANFENLLVVLNLIIGLLIVLSGIMSMFVLLNLANMYLLSKHTELTIMRINGFTIKETIGYAIREVLFTTSLGIILGVILGAIIVAGILRNMEQVHLMFIRTPNIPSCVLGALITSIFTFCIYAKAMKNVSRLNLKDIK